MNTDKVCANFNKETIFNHLYRLLKFIFANFNLWQTTYFYTGDVWKQIKQIDGTEQDCKTDTKFKYAVYQYNAIEQCQDRCQNDANCVGFVYSSQEKYSHYCFTCSDELKNTNGVVLKDMFTKNGIQKSFEFNFYKKPGNTI